MADVTVIGAGFAGLASALFLTRRGHNVCLLEKDQDGPPADGEACFEDWTRRGVAQARQPHLMLTRGNRVFQAEAPEVLAALAAGGANLLTNQAERVAPDDPDAVFFVASRRLPMEATLRRAVLAEPRVELLAGAEVEALQLRAEGEAPLVTGLQLTDGRRIDTDLVIDSSGRWSKAAEWLGAAGAQPPAELSQDCHFCYVSRWYRKRSGAAFPPGFMPLTVNSPFAPFICFPADAGVFALTMAVSLNDPLRGHLRRPELFQRLFQSIAEFAPWLDAAEPITEPQVMARIENRWRTLLRDGAPVARGFVQVGDSAIHTNPTFGRGISLGLVQAQQLARMLEEREPASAGLVRDFEAWREANLLVWYQAQVAADGRRLAVIERALAGHDPPEPEDSASRAVAALNLQAMEDPAVARALGRLMHMVVTPSELMADAYVSSSVAKRLEAGGSLVGPMKGPTRAEFEGLLA
jgi:2-polyprenyl-6-methoxyphenol hydroxylase-like FAD-dependent oxidoreductase